MINWTHPKKITPKGHKLNFSSPGNVIRFKDEWILCLQTYPGLKGGDETARIFIMRSADLDTWSFPEMMMVKGPDVPVKEMGRMIDPYLLEDKDKPGLWWCFYKQNGASISHSNDLKTWAYDGNLPCGENVCAIVMEDKYVLLHSPENGIGMKKSSDCIH